MMMIAAMLLIQAAAAPVEPTPPAARERKICRLMTCTGSIMPQHQCMTRAQWAKLAADGNDAWETARHSSHRSWAKGPPTL